MKKSDKDNCSFCGKPISEAKLSFDGISGAIICDTCAIRANEIIINEFKEKNRFSISREIAKPSRCRIRKE